MNPATLTPDHIAEIERLALKFSRSMKREDLEELMAYRRKLEELENGM